MAEPRVEVVPLRPAVRSDAAVELDVLIRITPPDPDPAAVAARPPLNLALVIDRSGSMAERNKLDFAKEAAGFVVRELRPADRVSLTVFDDRVETLAASAPAADPARLLGLVAGVEPRGGTALHGGWVEGAAQAAGGLVAGGLNRVLLLSDGLANVGESRPDAIASDVHARARAGVGTTTLGVGTEYNEDLLEAMARAGDGNYYFVESPAQLPALFRAELQGLTATVGTDATLRVDPGPGVGAAEVFNDLDRLPDGRLKLPNLVRGVPVYVAVRLAVPAAAGERRVCQVMVEWAAAEGGGRRSVAVGLTLPAVPGAAWEALAPHPEVQERVAGFRAARLKKQATRALERGDTAEARRLLADARAVLVGVPSSPEIDRELAAVSALEARIEAGDVAGTIRSGKFQSYTTSHSRPIVVPPPRDPV